MHSFKDLIVQRKRDKILVFGDINDSMENLHFFASTRLVNMT